MQLARRLLQSLLILSLAWPAAQAAARDYPDLPVPLQLRTAPTKLMKDLGYNQGYQWKAGFEPDAGFLPSELKDLKLFG